MTRELQTCCRCGPKRFSRMLTRLTVQQHVSRRIPRSTVGAGCAIRACPPLTPRRAVELKHRIHRRDLHRRATTPLLRPFRGLRPAPDRAADVIAPPYDVITSDEARALSAGKPWSFLHISRGEIDFPPGSDPYSQHVYAAGAASLARMVEEGVLVRDPTPCYYAYRMTQGEHSQTGIVGVGSLAHYGANRIRRHELTTPEKEDDRVRQIDSLNAQTGPVMSAYPEAPVVDAILAEAAGEAPDAEATDTDDVRHSLWVLRDPRTVERLSRGARFLPLYVRRLFVLFLIGIAHSLLLWDGDILHDYAELAVVLLVFRHRSLKTVLGWAGVFLCIPMLFYGITTYYSTTREAPSSLLTWISYETGYEPGGEAQDITEDAGRIYSR